ncbi:MAG: ABC transporter ATP-binding protein [Erysipelotrichaceae bacterium]|nr:ABC transporter ATP-binding protein [Erysipelotrichaceae bacterium]
MLKTLGKQIKQFKLASILTPFFMFMEVLTETIIPLLMASMIDNGVNKGNMNHILYIAMLMLGMALLALFTGYMGNRLGAYAGCGFAHNLRETMYERIQEFSFSNIDKFSTAGLVTRLTTDVSNVQMAYSMGLRMAVRAPSNLIVAMVMAFLISPKIALIYVAATVILMIAIVILLPITSRNFRAVFTKYDDLNESVQENVSAIRVVKAYVREDYEQEKFNKAAGNIYRLFVKAEKLTATFMPFMSFIIYGSILLVSWRGAHLIAVGELTTGNLTTLLTYCMQILMSMMMLGMMFVMITMSAASAKRIAEVIEEESDLKEPEDPLYEVPDGSIVFDHVDFAYKKDDNLILSDIDLKIGSGETVGLVGATGSGKSSFVSLIPRLYDTVKGNVYVGGHNVKEYDLDTLHNAVAMVLQKNELFSGSIYDNLRWGNENATDEECQKAAAIAQASEFIERFPDGYNTHIEQGGTNVSGGQKQRLCIARALLKNPRILILDDSTSAVDTATEAKMRKAFREDIPDITKIIIAQRISSVQDADKIIVLDDGKISAYGTHEELLKSSPIYASIYESQTGGNGDFDEGGE